MSEDIHPRTGELWGNFPQTYSLVGLDQYRDAAVAKLGKHALAMGRLVVVSNRVALPKETRAGGLASALHGALAEHGGLWFGWSGRVVAEGERDVHAAPSARATSSTR